MTDQLFFRLDGSELVSRQYFTETSAKPDTVFFSLTNTCQCDRVAIFKKRARRIRGALE